MSQPGSNQVSFANTARTAQIIRGALIAGLCVFGAIAMVVKEDGAPNPLMAYVGLGFAATDLVVWSIVPRQSGKAELMKLPELDEAQQNAILAQVYMTRTIIAGALLEGAGFLNWVSYLTAKQTWTLGIIAMLIALMAITFPSQSELENWADEMKRNYR